MSENVDIDYLEGFKNDLITELRKLSKRIDALEKKQQEQAESSLEFYAGRADELKSAILKSSSRAAQAVPVSGSEGTGGGLSDYDIRRIIKTFNDGLISTRNELIQFNSDVKADAAREAAAYNKRFNESFSELLERNSDNMKDKLAEHDEVLHKKLVEQYDGVIGRIEQNHAAFCEQLKGYSEELAVRNAEALENVQKENNQELLNISRSLDRQVQNHDEFIRNCTEFNSGLKEGINTIIEQNNGIVAAFGDAASENNVRTEQLWEKYLNELCIKLDALEKKNAGYFHSAMNDYRESFIAANSEAMRSVQSELLDRIAQTQQQLSELAKKTDSIDGMIEELYNDINTFMEEQKELSENEYSSLKRIVENSLKNNEGCMRDVKRSVSDIAETVEKTTALVEKSSADYNKAIQVIRENQENLKSLSKEDINLLKGLLK